LQQTPQLRDGLLEPVLELIVLAGPRKEKELHLLGQQANPFRIHGHVSQENDVPPHRLTGKLSQSEDPSHYYGSSSAAESFDYGFIPTNNNNNLDGPAIRETLQTVGNITTHPQGFAKMRY
jgi:hypothetical protein